MNIVLTLKNLQAYKIFLCVECFYPIKYFFVLNAYNDRIMLLSAGVEFNFFIQMFPSSSKANSQNAFKASIT